METKPAPVEATARTGVPWRALLPVPVLAWIAVGGAVGALARYGVLRALPASPGHFPWGTWLVNVVGSFALGLVLGAVTVGAHIHPHRRAFLATGVIGAFTTFSTWAVDVDHLLAAGHVALAVLDVGATLVVGLVSLATGARLVRARHHRRYRRAHA